MFAITLNEYNLPYPPPIESAVHPILVHFVIAMVIFSFLFDLLGHLTRNQKLHNAGWWNLVVGTTAIVVAIFFGQFEAGLAHYSPGLKPILDGHTLIGWALGAILLILATWRGILRYRNPGKVNVAYLGAAFAMVGIVCYQAVLGTQLVWIYGIHVKPVVEATRQGVPVP